MGEKFLVGTKLIGNNTVGYSLNRKVAIPTKSILKIEDGVNTSYCQDIIEKCNNYSIITETIRKEQYLGTYIYYEDPPYKNPQIIHLIESFDECISQLQS